jgi:predicted phosphodiesterase
MEARMRSHRTLVIGDIHGRYGMLRSVLKVAGYEEEDDELILLGDLIDRPGRESREVLEFLSDLRVHGRRPTILLGNHEYVIKAIAEGHLPALPEWMSTYGGDKTLWSYGIDPSRIRVSGHWVWFNGRPMNGHQFLLRAFPPDHLALIEASIPTLVVKNVCDGVDLLLSHAGPTSDKSFSEMEDWLWAMGDEQWYRTGTAAKFPRNLIHVFGHFHASRPVLQPGRIGLAMIADVAVYSVEERRVYISDGQVVDVMPEWVCPGGEE